MISCEKAAERGVHMRCRLGGWQGMLFCFMKQILVERRDLDSLKTK